MKRAIIIGASSGIGKEIARLLVKHNYHVGITGRRMELLQELKNDNPTQFFIKDFDVSDPQVSIVKLNELVLELGGVDLIVISAGTGDINQNLDFDVEHRTILTNVMGFTSIADWAFNYFEKQKFGHLVAISSIAGVRGNGSAPAYNASKAYQINYLEGLSQRAAKLKLPIFVTDVRPGFVDTRMAKGDGLFWVASTEKAANQINSAIKMKSKIVYVTKRWKLIGVILKLIPQSIYLRM